MKKTQVAGNHPITFIKLHTAFVVQYVFLLVLDFYTKHISAKSFLKYEDKVDTTLYQGSSYQLFDLNIAPLKLLFNLKLTYVRNEAAAYNIMLSLNETLRDIIYVVLFVLVVPPIAYFLSKRFSEQRVALFSIGIMVIGSIGNMADRLVNGYVIDWIRVGGRLFGIPVRVPAFNLADIYIVAGFLILSYCEFKRGKDLLKQVSTQE